YTPLFRSRVALVAERVEGPDPVHHAPPELRAASIAQKTASGVEGQPRSTVVPSGPKAAHACRSASRTLNASISGGSPTALEPWTTAGSAASAWKSTLNTSGSSEKLGSL